MKRRIVREWSFTTLIVCVVILFTNQLFAATTGKIAGIVKDAASGDPLPGVNIVVEGTTMGAATDLEGHYFILNVPPGSYQVKASMIGYQDVVQTNVLVSINHTTTLNFALSIETIEGETVVVEAEKEIIQMDMSSSVVAATEYEIKSVPLVTNIQNYINLQAGISGWSVRGGGADETAFMTDGLIMMDNRANQPLITPNLSTIKEMEIIKGGFNAEYGNVRSGVINVVTNDGSGGYTGSLELKLTPPYLRHSGKSYFDPDNWFVKPFVDPSMAFDGLSDEQKKIYRDFGGWNKHPDVVAGRLTAEEARQRFIWLHRLEGADALTPPGYKGPDRVGKDGDKWTTFADVGFGGPVPFLKDLSFFVSHKIDRDPFAVPTNRDFYTDDNTQLRLTYRLSPSMKLSMIGMNSKTETVSNVVKAEDYYGNTNKYVTSGRDILFRDIANSGGAYYPSYYSRYDIMRQMTGLSFDHVLSPKTFYNIRLTMTEIRNEDNGPHYLRDTTTVRYFGSIPVDEAPYGFTDAEDAPSSPVVVNFGDYGSRTRDHTKTTTVNVKGDITSQVNRYHQLKAGFEYNSDHIQADYGSMRDVDVWVYKSHVKYDHTPIRMAAYVQDKIEFEGMIANIGLRADYIDPNTDWFVLDSYSPWFLDMNAFRDNAPRKKVDKKIKLSPRLGISHPISDKTKLFFNYGWFYSVPRTDFYYIIYAKDTENRIAQVGNAFLELPRTISYELGFEMNLLNQFLVRTTGYYKDVSDEPGWIDYQDYDASVNYTTSTNNHYSDTRGVEIEVRKRFGRWLQGFLIYDYRVEASGYLGRKKYFEDPMLQRNQGLQEPENIKQVSRARPLFRGNVNFMVPDDFGPKFAGHAILGGLQTNFLYTWRAGQWQTWDPLDLKLRDNVQRKATQMLDLRVSKLVDVKGLNTMLYLDIHNVFNFKELNLFNSFMDEADRNAYFESLHLPMYNDPKYQNAGYKGGEDKIGDVKSDDKPHIDMPNIDTLWYTDPRTVSFGVRLYF